MIPQKCPAHKAIEQELSALKNQILVFTTAESLARTGRNPLVYLAKSGFLGYLQEGRGAEKITRTGKVHHLTCPQFFLLLAR